jgi:hypothetical protein
MGNVEYNGITNAQAAPMPSSLPPQFDGIGVLIGQVVVKQGEAFGTVQTAGSNFTPGSPIPNHNDNAGLQGGAVTEYFHLTSREYQDTQETIFNIGSNYSDPTLSIDLVNGKNQRVIITSSISSISMTNWKTSSYVSRCRVLVSTSGGVTINTTGWLVPNGFSFTSGGTDLVEFVSYDGGTTKMIMPLGKTFV